MREALFIPRTRSPEPEEEEEEEEERNVSFSLAATTDLPSDVMDIERGGTGQKTVVQDPAPPEFLAADDKCIIPLFFPFRNFTNAAVVVWGGGVVLGQPVMSTTKRTVGMGKGKSVCVSSPSPLEVTPSTSTHLRSTRKREEGVSLNDAGGGRNPSFITLLLYFSLFDARRPCGCR